MVLGEVFECRIAYLTLGRSRSAEFQLEYRIAYLTLLGLGWLVSVGVLWERQCDCDVTRVHHWVGDDVSGVFRQWRTLTYRGVCE